MKPMYPAMVNSPITEISSAITASQTSITLLNGEALPAAPNIAVIGQGENAETILYTTKTGNTLSGVTRGLQGTAQSWLVGSKVARNYTAYDHNTFVENMIDIETLQIAFALKLADKAQIVVTENPPAVVDRLAGSFYFHITDSVPIPTDTENLRVSPNMGIKILE